MTANWNQICEGCCGGARPAHLQDDAEKRIQSLPQSAAQIEARQSGVALFPEEEPARIVPEIVTYVPPVWRHGCSWGEFIAFWPKQTMRRRGLSLGNEAPRLASAPARALGLLSSIALSSRPAFHSVPVPLAGSIIFRTPVLVPVPGQWPGIRAPAKVRSSG